MASAVHRSIAVLQEARGFATRNGCCTLATKLSTAGPLQNYSTCFESVSSRLIAGLCSIPRGHGPCLTGLSNNARFCVVCPADPFLDKSSALSSSDGRKYGR